MNKPQKIVLASSSPRRKEILKYLFDHFEVASPLCNEETDIASPADAVVAVAMRKALWLKAPADTLVLGADTVVYHDNKILGKPKDEEEAFAMLASLSGSTCTVFTGVGILYGGRSYSLCCRSEVSFYPLSSWQIAAYVASGQCMDKAGAFGAQEKGALLIKSITGDFYNVMGLPVAAINQLLISEGII